MSNILDINGGGQPPKQQQVNVDLTSAPEVKCPKCGGIFYQELTFFKKLSALVSPTGKETIVPISTYACVECGTVNPAFLPVGFSKEME